MDAERIDIRRLQAAGIQQLVQVRRHLDQREVEHLAAVHEEFAVGHFQVLGTGAVSAEARLTQVPYGAFTHPGGCGGIAEQHGGVAVFRVDDLRIRVGGDQQAVFQPCSFHEPLIAYSHTHSRNSPATRRTPPRG